MDMLMRRRIMMMSGSGPSVFSITSDLTYCTSSNPATTVELEASYTTTIAAIAGYAIDSVNIMMGASDITSTAFDSQTGVVYIASVTGAITISASAILANNYAYDGIYYGGEDGGSCIFGIANPTYMISPLFDTTNTTSLTFSVGGTRIGDYIACNDDGRYNTYYMSTANPRTVSLTSGYRRKFAFVCFQKANLASTYVYDNTNGVYLFKGDELDASMIHSWESFRSESVLANGITWENARGDFENWNFGNSSTPVSNNAKSTYNPPMYRRERASWNTTAAYYNSIITKFVNLPKNGEESKSTIEFSVGAVYESGNNPCILYYNDTAQTASYNMPSSNPRTVTLSVNLDRARMIIPSGNYSTAYIKDATTGTYLWQGPQSE